MKYILRVLIFFLLFSCCKDIKKKSYFENGQLKSIKFFKVNAKLPFCVVDYYESGKIKDSLKYDCKGLLNGLLFFNYPEEGYYKFTEYRNDTINGDSYVFLTDGTILLQQFSKGVLNGIDAHYYKNGEIEEIYRINGKAFAHKSTVLIEPGDSVLCHVTTKDKTYFELEVASSKKTLTSVEVVNGNKVDQIGSISKNIEGEVIDDDKNSYVDQKIKSDSVYYKGYFGNFRDAIMKIDFGRVVNGRFCAYEGRSYNSCIEKEISIPLKTLNTLGNSVLGRVSVLRGDTILYETLIFHSLIDISTISDYHTLARL